MRALFAFLLIIIGILILGENLAWWQGIDLDAIFELWPLILIILGVSLISRRFASGALIVLVVTLVCAAFALVTLVSPELVGRQAPTPMSEDGYQLTQVIDSDIESAKLRIVTGAAKLKLDGQSSNLIDVWAARGFNGVTLDQNTVDGVAELKLNTDVQKRWRFSRERDMQVSLSPQLAYELDLNAGASEITLDLRDLIISGLKVDAGAAALNITVGPLVTNEAEINLKAGAASIDIVVPEPIGVKINSRSGLASTDFVDFEKISDNLYQSKNYAQATKKINLNIEVGASSVRVSSY